MSKGASKPPSGMRDFLPAAVVRRREVVSVITAAYERHGFVPIETPAIERLDTLLGKYGEEGDQLIYRILHRRDALARPIATAHAEGREVLEGELADLGLRYDLTVPLARVVAEYRELPRFFKRYQIQPVWRADRPGRGRFREFWQCDVDVVGTTSVVAEAEICAAVCDALHGLGFASDEGPSFTIRVNHRELLRALVRAAGIAPAMESPSLVALDKLDKIGREGVLKELVSRGIGTDSAGALLDLAADDAGAPELARLRERVDERGRAAIDDIEGFLTLARGNGTAARLRFAPELARGLGYYTGLIFEIAVAGLSGSLGGGGRYDGLVGMFGARPVPAVGFSLGLERILVIMDERNMAPPSPPGAELVLCWIGIEPVQAIEVATRLRATDLRVEVHPEVAKLGKQLQYASELRARFAAIVGPDELAEGVVTLKDLTTGEQVKTAIDRVRATVREH